MRMGFLFTVLAAAQMVFHYLGVIGVIGAVAAYALGSPQRAAAFLIAGVVAILLKYADGYLYARLARAYGGPEKPEMV